MGYAYYETRKGPAGYGVMDTCAEDGCSKKIDRGLSYLCGDNPHSPDPGCGWWYCAAHLYIHEKYGQMCGACCKKADDEDGEAG